MPFGDSIPPAAFNSSTSLTLVGVRSEFVSSSFLTLLGVERNIFQPLYFVDGTVDRLQLLNPSLDVSFIQCNLCPLGLPLYIEFA